MIPLLLNPSVRSRIRKTWVYRHVLMPLMRLMNRHVSYEERFACAMFTSIRQGDCIWDVGANVGVYTRRFAQAVGPEGAVVAFEPVDATYNKLVTCMPAESVGGRVFFKKCALGACEETVRVPVTQDYGGVTNSLVNREPVLDDNVFEDLVVCRGDSLVVSDPDLPTPTVIKIDTEGYEEDVLNGIRNILFSAHLPRVRAIFIEVHFALLDKRGTRDAPTRIVSLLKDAGFSVRWTDKSHLIAERV